MFVITLSPPGKMKTSCQIGCKSLLLVNTHLEKNLCVHKRNPGLHSLGFVMQKHILYGHSGTS